MPWGTLGLLVCAMHVCSYIDGWYPSPVMFVKRPPRQSGTQSGSICLGSAVYVFNVVMRIDGFPALVFVYTRLGTCTYLFIRTSSQYMYLCS
jgi:hypothetical protein